MAARAAAPSAAARAVPGRLFAHARQTSTSQRDPVRRRRGDQDGASTGCRRWHNSACVSLFLCFHFSAKSDSGREARPLRPRLRMRGPAIFKSAPLCSRPASVSTSKLRLSRLLSPRRRRSKGGRSPSPPTLGSRRRRVRWATALPEAACGGPIAAAGGDTGLGAASPLVADSSASAQSHLCRPSDFFIDIGRRVGRLFLDIRPRSRVGTVAANGTRGRLRNAESSNLRCRSMNRSPLNVLFWVFTGQAVAGTKMGDRACFPGECGVGYGGATVVKEDVASPCCRSRPFPPFSAQMIVVTYLRWFEHVLLFFHPSVARGQETSQLTKYI